MGRGKPSGAKAGKGVILLRPFLSISKERLVATCRANNIPFLKDPSNVKMKFARPRLRKAKAILEEEGLSAKRLAITANRLERARKALEKLTEDAFKKNLSTKNTKRIVFHWKTLMAEPEEIKLRVLLKAIRHLRPDAAYAPRMEKIEDLAADLFTPQSFRKRTLGGLVFERDDRKKMLIVSVEK
jgi:tRNA(Ile)-lysidine synthase